MRFIIPGPLFDDTFQDNVAFTLRRMGHDVITMPPISQKRYASRIYRYYGLLRDKLTTYYLPPYERWLLKAVQEYRPDVLLALTVAISEGTLFQIKKRSVQHCIAWWGDALGHMQQMGLFTDAWDVMFFKDPAAVRKFRSVHLNTHLLHEAMNPEWHKPLAVQKNDDVVVVGNFYDYRQFLVRRLLRAGVSVGLYGSRPPVWAHREIRSLHTGRYLVRDEKSRIFGEGLACLNSTHVIEGNSLNCRAFEIAGAGGLQLMEYKPIIEECFEPNKELFVFKNVEDLLEHVDRARSYPKEVALVRAAGAKRALAEHTYEHRLKTMLGMIDA